MIQTNILTTPILLPSDIFRKSWFGNSFIPSTHLPALTDFAAHPCMYTWWALFPKTFQNISLNVFLENGLTLKTCLLPFKISDISRNDVCFYLYSCILFTFTTVQYLVSLSYKHSETDALKIEFINGFMYTCWFVPGFSKYKVYLQISKYRKSTRYIITIM